MYVLTQFNSASLNRHLSQTYNLNAGFGQGFVEVLAAQQTLDSPSWFEGTADAVRQYQTLFSEWDVDEYLILSGDQLYRMDYSRFVEHHRSTGADLTVAALPVDAAQAEDGDAAPRRRAPAHQAARLRRQHLPARRRARVRGPRRREQPLGRQRHRPPRPRA